MGTAGCAIWPSVNRGLLRPILVEWEGAVGVWLWRTAWDPMGEFAHRVRYWNNFSRSLGFP